MLTLFRNFEYLPLSSLRRNTHIQLILRYPLNLPQIPDLNRFNYHQTNCRHSWVDFPSPHKILNLIFKT